MHLYFGTYTEMISPDFGGHGDGIYCYDFDEATGALVHLHTIPTRNPSYLTIHPNKRWLYSVEEVPHDQNPMLNAWHIQADGNLELINSQELPDGFPCHLDVLEEDVVAVACYEHGFVVAHPIDERGALMAASSVFQHEGKGVNPERQECAHAHIIAWEAAANRIAVCDLGMDQVLFYEKAAQSLTPLPELTIALPDGAGPRHLAYHPDGVTAFVLNELEATISVLTKQNEAWQLQSTTPTLRPNANPAASAIRTHTNGRFVYYANRGDNSIALFEFDGAHLNLKAHYDTGGQTPRDFNLSPSGEWLLVGHQETDLVNVFRVDLASGELELKRGFEVRSVVCLEWNGKSSQTNTNLNFRLEEYFKSKQFFESSLIHPSLDLMQIFQKDPRIDFKIFLNLMVFELENELSNLFKGLENKSLYLEDLIIQYCKSNQLIDFLSERGLLYDAHALLRKQLESAARIIELHTKSENTLRGRTPNIQNTIKMDIGKIKKELSEYLHVSSPEKLNILNNLKLDDSEKTKKIISQFVQHQNLCNILFLLSSLGYLNKKGDPQQVEPIMQKLFTLLRFGIKRGHLKLSK